MDYRKKYLNRTGFKSGSGILASAPWYRGTTGPSQILKAPRGFTGMQEILAGGILGTGASKFLEDEDKENLPVETEETKLPKKEPPEDKDPDIALEIATELTLEKVRSDVKFKQSKYANTTEVYYKGKKYAEIEKRPDKEKYKGLSDYDLKYPSGEFLENGEEVFTVEDAWLGFKDAKDALIQGIYNNLKTEKKAHGGLIDKPLTGGIRYI